MARARSTSKDRPAKPERSRSTTDGRVARSERARAAIIDAMIALLDEGNLRPTSQEVAERARVSLRLVFHHVRDMESLFQEASAKVVEQRVLPLIEPPVTEGPLEERLAIFILRRARLFEAVGPLRRAAENMEPFSPAIAGWMSQGRMANATEALEFFQQELEPLSSDERQRVSAALSMATSFTAWEILRRHQGMSLDEAKATLAELLRRLVRPVGK